jgi:hypothetical protein
MFKKTIVKTILLIGFIGLFTRTRSTQVYYPYVYNLEGPGILVNKDYYFFFTKQKKL